MGAEKHGVAGEGDESAHLPLARGLDLVGEGGHGILAAELGQAAHAAPALVEVPALAEAVGQGQQSTRVREHGAPGPVEVAGDDVEHVDEPARERPELLGRGAHAAVGHGGGRRGEGAGEGADVGGGEARGRRHRFGWQGVDQASHVLEPVGEAPRRRPGAHAALGEEHLEQGQQQQRVGARADGQVLVGQGRGLGAPRVHHHEAPAARAQGLEPPLDARAPS